MLAALVSITLGVSGADLVVENAKIWSDGRFLEGSFMAISGGVIENIGSHDPRKITAATKRIDAKGHIVIPGMIDSHTHLLEGGVSLLQLQLQGARSMAEFVRMIKQYADKLPKDKWVIGTGWSAESWPEKAHPTKETIDAACGGRPAMLERMDGHSCLVNSAALAMMKITKDGPPNPAGGVIDRDPKTNEPTGMLRERAMSLANFVVPGPSKQDVVDGFRLAIKQANRLGITAVSDISSIDSWNLYKDALGTAAPTMRFALYGRTGDWASAISGVKAFANRSNWVEARGLKAFMDGSLGSRTAYMHEPFTKALPAQKELRGVPMPGAVDGTYAKGFRLAAESGLQVIVHAIGDQANHDVLNLFIGAASNTASHRFRVEHAQHILPEDIARFGKLGVIPSMQPFHKADDGRYCDEVIGVERSKSSYAYRSLLESGARLAFGSDWPVITIDPFEGLRTAVTGRIMTGAIWNPQQNISVDEAIRCYTSNGAYAMKWENWIGKLATGFAADFVILDASPWEPNPDWERVKPLRVFVGGNQCYP